MNPEARGLLDAILEDPHDDTPRRIYADWLEDQGDGGSFLTASLIRRMVAEGGGVFRKVKAGKVQSLYVPKLCNLYCPFKEAASSVVWCRGFIERVECSFAEWEEHGKRLVQEHPITTVRVTGRRAVEWDVLERVSWWLSLQRPVSDMIRGNAHWVALPFSQRSRWPKRAFTEETHYRRVFFSSRESADDALSDVMLGWAGARHLKQKKARK